MKNNSEIRKYISDILLEAPEDRARAIVESPSTRAIMEELSAQDAYLIIREAWETDGQILLQYVPTRNVPLFFDLDCWEKDSFSMENLVEWFWTLSEVSLDHLVGVLDEMDPELIVMFFQRYLEVAHVSPTDENIPDLVAMGFDSFDNTFFFRFNEQLQENELVRSLIKAVYSNNVELYYAIMSYTGWEFSSEMEETAYRQRTLRLMELGFAAPAESLGIYRRIDPAKLVRKDLDERKTPRLADGEYSVPCIYRDELEKDRDLIVSALQELGGRTEERFLFEMVYLANKIMMADYRPVNDTAEIAAAVRLARAHISLGLDFYIRTRQSDSATILRNSNAETLFSLGYNLVLEQRERLKRLMQSGAGNLLPAADAEALSGLLTGRRPARGYTFPEYDELRLRLDQLEAMQILAASLEWQGQDLNKTNAVSAEGLDLENIILTALAVNMATGVAAFVPLKKTEARAFISRITGGGGNRIVPDFKDELAGLIGDHGIDAATAAAVAARLAQRCGQELCQINPAEFDPRYLTSLVIEIA